MERGSATIKVTLIAGRIKVVHGKTGEVLLDRKAYDGDWNKLWAALEGEI